LATNAPDVYRKKHLNYIFIDTAKATDGSGYNWVRIMTSVDFAIAYNPNSISRDYISYATPSVELDSYRPQLKQTQTAIIGDPIYDFIADMARNQATGFDAVTNMMIVTQNKDADGNELAYMCEVLITIDTDDYVAATITYSIDQRGDRTYGTATVRDNMPTFVPAVSVAP